MLVAIVVLASACGGHDTSASAAPGGGGAAGALNIEGSSTVAPFTREAIERFETLNRGARVTTGEKGSGAGITALIKKEVPLAASSRRIKPDEVAQARAAGVEPVEIEILKDALVIVVHPSNPVARLTEQQVAQIFAGRITNWKQVGGRDERITLYSRNEESGAFSYMQDEVIRVVLGKDAKYSLDINKMQSAPAGLTAVANDRRGIFYAGLGNIADLGDQAARIKPLAIAKSACKDGACTSSDTFVQADEHTVFDNSYPISRGLYFYSNGPWKTADNHVLTAFVEFVLSPEGQRLGAELGFVPVAPATSARADDNQRVQAGAP